MTKIKFLNDIQKWKEKKYSYTSSMWKVKYFKLCMCNKRIIISEIKLDL